LRPTGYTCSAMAPWLGAAVISALLWGSWVALWRQASLPVLLGGVWLPLVLLGATAAKRLRVPFPARAWLRLDLWGAFLFLMAWRVLWAVASTAWAILRGQARPGVVAFPLRLRSDMGRLLLLWAITVTPGTIALLLEGDLLYVHCLRRPAGPAVPGLERLESLLKKLWD